MAELNITEFSKLAIIGAEYAPVAAAGKDPQNISFTTTSTQSSSLVGAIVRVVASANCRIAIGQNPTATASSMRIIADTPEYFGVTPGDKIAVIEG